MVLYFTGTGNSRYVAEKIANELEDELFSINSAIKSGDDLNKGDYDKLIFVTPTYAWRIPRVVNEWIINNKFNEKTPAWFVMTCGGEIGNAAKYIIKLCDKKSFEYMGTAQIVMPENYIAMFSAPARDEAIKIIESAQADIRKVIDDLKLCHHFSVPRNNLYDKMMSGPVNPLFYSFYVKSDNFVADEKCIGCGKCVTVCPLNNVTLNDSKPVWGNKCTHCMACICYCPTGAIEYGKNSIGKPRYNIEDVLK